MPFLLLLLLTLVCLQARWQEPWAWDASPWESVGLTWLGVVLMLGTAAVIAHRVRRLAHMPGHRETALRRYGSWRLYHFFGLLGMFGLVLYALGWGWALQSLGGWPKGLPPGGELLLLAPFLTVLVGSWALFYDAEKTLHDTASDAAPSDPYWSRWAYLGFHLRQNLALVCIPLLLMMLMKLVLLVVSRLPGADDETWQKVPTLIAMVVILVAFASIPWALRLVLGLKPFPECPLRDRLLATAKRLHFRCSNILLWDTRGGVANAMVAGILPFPRYVVLTDRLATDLTPDEVEAVFGHEVGHVKHSHMLYYLGFLMVSMVTVWALLGLCVPELTQDTREDLAALPAVAVAGAYIFVVFGFLSRRCERQADIYGCRAVSCSCAACDGHREGISLAPQGRGLCPTGIRTFIDALEKVARVNGISRDKPGWLQSWQHSTIARRVDFLQCMLTNPGLEPRFQRRVGLVKWGLLLGLGGLLLLLGTMYGWDKLQLQ